MRLFHTRIMRRLRKELELADYLPGRPQGRPLLPQETRRAILQRMLAMSAHGLFEEALEDWEAALASAPLDEPLDDRERRILLRLVFRLLTVKLEEGAAFFQPNFGARLSTLARGETGRAIRFAFTRGLCRRAFFYSIVRPNIQQAWRSWRAALRTGAFRGIARVLWNKLRRDLRLPPPGPAALDTIAGARDVEASRDLQPGSPMAPRRKGLISALALLLLGGQLYVLAIQVERWPFSHYPMYVRVRRDWPVERPIPVGVRQDRPDEEFALLQASYIYPFDNATVHRTLARFHQGPHRETLLREALLDMLKRYEERRRRGLHSGPPLSALRLYQCHWALGPAATTLQEPTRRELLFEVTLSEPNREP
jgi:hypothetical protein